MGVVNIIFYDGALLRRFPHRAGLVFGSVGIGGYGVVMRLVGTPRFAGWCTWLSCLGDEHRASTALVGHLGAAGSLDLAFAYEAAFELSERAECAEDIE
jgi:hypothetical protein